MAREAVLEINCNRYSEKIIDIINLLNEIGWKYYNAEKEIMYLPLGDDDFNWQHKYLSEKEFGELVDKKQDNFEQIGLSLYFESSKEGIILRAKSTKEIVIDLDINRRTTMNSRESITDIGWYFNNIIQRLQEKECPIDYIKFEEYID